MFEPGSSKSNLSTGVAGQDSVSTQTFTTIRWLSTTNRKHSAYPVPHFLDLHTSPCQLTRVMLLVVSSDGR